jgi:ribosomal protein L31
MTLLGVKKELGVSWTVDANGNSHTFYTGEQHHPRMHGIHLFKLYSTVELGTAK